MRLTAQEVAAIKTAAAAAFGPGAVVRLFGSRVHDHLRGGDIDLMIEVDALEHEQRQTDAFERQFWALTEPRRVDVLLAVRGCPTGPFERIAYRDGVVL